MQESLSYIRPATDKDYPDMWRIWMQDHIVRWMSFPPMSFDDFKDRYNKLKRQSDIYVMIDKFDNEEKIVGVRRIKYLEGKYSHVAEFCSMGIDKEMLGRGYGKKFTEEFEKIVTKENVKRIQLTQSGGNNPAFSLSDKYDYEVEAIFPDWLEREGEQEAHHFVLERYISKFIDKELQKKVSDIPSLKYEAKLPSLTKNPLEDQLTVTLNNNKIIVMNQNKSPVLEFEYFPDDSVIKHIAFLDNVAIQSTDDSLSEAAFRKALNYILQNEKIKKLELLTHQPEVIQLCACLGFWVRGERFGACQIDGNYYNELGLEYSYFGINEAINFTKSFNADNNASLEQAILFCKDIISDLTEAKKCDILGNRYLQYIVYQMVRDSHEVKNYASLCDKPWQGVISQCPEEFQLALQKLNKELQKENKFVKNHSSSNQFFVLSIKNEVKKNDVELPVLTKLVQ